MCAWVWLCAYVLVRCVYAHVCVYARACVSVRAYVRVRCVFGCRPRYVFGGVLRVFCQSEPVMLFPPRVLGPVPYEWRGENVPCSSSGSSCQGEYFEYPIF